jgi:hypothetical protein
MGIVMMDENLVLAEFEAAQVRQESISLSDWISRYPDHADALRRFALFADVVREREGLEAEDPDAEDRFAQRAVLVAERLRAEGVAVGSQTLSGILKAASQRGMSATDLAQRLRLSVSFVARLDQRLFVPASVPGALLARLAELLSRTVGDVAAYLALPPRAALAADYRSSSAPAIREQIDFHEAVAAALDLSEAQKAEWLEGVDDPTA